MKTGKHKQDSGAPAWLNPEVPLERIKHRLWLDKGLIEEIKNSYKAINPKKNNPIVTGWSDIKEMIWIFVSKAWSCLGALAEVDLVLDSLKNEDEFKRDVAYLNKRLEFFNSLAMEEMIGIETAFYEWHEPCQEFLLYQDILFFLKNHPIDQQPEEERVGNIKKIISTDHKWGDDLFSRKISIQEPAALTIWASYLRTLLFIYTKLLPIKYLFIRPMDMLRIDGACVCVLSNTQKVSNDLKNIVHTVYSGKNKGRGKKAKSIKLIRETLLEIISECGIDNTNNLPESGYTLFRVLFKPKWAATNPGDWPLQRGKDFMNRLEKDFKIIDRPNGKPIVNYKKFYDKYGPAFT